MLSISLSGAGIYSRSAKSAVTAALSAQTLRFGALTPANTGGAQLRDDNGAIIPVTGVISTISGDGSGWTAAGGRLVRTTATPASSNGAVLRVAYAGGAVDVTIATDAWTYDIVETADLAVAEADMHARKLEPGATTAAWVMRLRDGVELVELPGTAEITLWPWENNRAYEWSEAPGVPEDEILYWPNRHAQTDAEYNYAAVAYFRGGHLAYTCETPGGAAFRAAVHLDAAVNTHFKWLRFEHTAQQGDGKYVNPSLADASKPWPERETVTTPIKSQWRSARVITDHIPKKRFLFTQCKFGGERVLYDDGVTPVIDSHWLDTRVFGNFPMEQVTQDCVFSGYREAGPVSPQATLSSMVRNVSHQRIIDFHKAGSLNIGHVIRFETAANLEYEINDNPDFAGDHADFHQAGANKEEGGLNHFVARNIVDTTLFRTPYLYKADHPAGGAGDARWPAITAGTGGTVNGVLISTSRGSQGFLAVPHSNPSRPINGYIGRNLVICDGPVGIIMGTTSPDMLVEYNTLLFPTNVTQPDETAYGVARNLRFSIGTSDRVSIYNDGRVAPPFAFSRVRGNIAHVYDDLSNFGYEADNIDLNALIGGGDNYRNAGTLAALYEGPFTPSVSGDRYTYRKDSYANAWADLTAIFTPKVGSGVEAAGFTAPFVPLPNPGAPLLVSRFPVNGGTVGTLSYMQLTFDRPIVLGPGAITLYKSDGTLVEVLLSDQNRIGFEKADFSGATLTLTPATDLVEGDSYYITVAADALMEAASLAPYAGLLTSADWTFTAVAAPDFDVAGFFAANPAMDGAAYDPSNLSTLWQDTAATIPVTADGQLVARMDDVSGRGRHAVMLVETERPIYRTDGAQRWLELTVDRHVCTFPIGAAVDWEIAFGYVRGAETAANLISATAFSFAGRFREPSALPTSTATASWARVNRLYSDGRNIPRITQEAIYGAVDTRRVVTIRFDTTSYVVPPPQPGLDWAKAQFPARIGAEGAQGRFYGAVMAKTVAVSPSDRIGIARWLRKRMDATGVSLLATEAGPLTTGTAQTAALIVPATATGESMVVTAALSVSGPFGAVLPQIDWIPDATGVADPMAVTASYPLSNVRWEAVVAVLNAPTPGPGGVRLRHVLSDGTFGNVFPSTAVVHHLSRPVTAASAGGSASSGITAISDAFTTPAAPALTFSVAALLTQTTGVDPAPVQTGVGDVTLAHWTGGSTTANGAVRHWVHASGASAAVSVGMSWTGSGAASLQRVTVVG